MGLYADPWRPSWERCGGPAAKAHLRIAGSGPHPQAICGTTEHDGVNHAWTPAPYSDRCARCLSALEQFREAAYEIPDPLVTETVIVQVTRPGSADNSNLAETIARDLGKHKSWQIAAALQDKEA